MAVQSLGQMGKGKGREKAGSIDRSQDSRLWRYTAI